MTLKDEVCKLYFIPTFSSEISCSELADVAEQTRALVLLQAKGWSKSGNNIDGDKIDGIHPLAANEQHKILEEDHSQAIKCLEKLGSEKESQVRLM